MTAHRHTPALNLYDARGKDIGALNYHSDDATPRSVRRTRQVFDAVGNLRAVVAPRLPNACLHTVPSVSSFQLSITHTDSGRQIILPDASSQLLFSWDAMGQRTRAERDDSGRLLALYIGSDGSPERCSERFVHAANTAQEKARNRCGRVTRVDDSAGSTVTEAFSLLGKPLDEASRLLASDDEADWPEPVADRDALLEATASRTRRRYDAFDQPWEQTDACGNVQRSACNLDGTLLQIRLRLAHGGEHTLVETIDYDIHGQARFLRAGNGVTSQWLRADEDSRLLQQSARHGDGTPLQALHYAYDPTGLRQWCLDSTVPVRHFRQQRTDGLSTYRYDSLHQLIEATGREGLHPGDPGADLPALLPLPSSDDTLLVNYTERYRYDAGGNLLELQHQGSWNAKRVMQVDTASNRAVPEGESLDDAFDSSGNLKRLSGSAALTWDARNRLARVVQVVRDGVNDAEYYRYAFDGQRKLKRRTWSAGGAQHVQEVRYLHGIERRSNSATGEVLQAIVVQAGPVQVRVLHWEQGKPDALANDALRFSLSDHQGSCRMELDAEGMIMGAESYYPYGGTAWHAARSALEVSYKVIRYSGKERDHTGLYYYGQRYYAPWLMRWISADPGGTIDGLNLYLFVRCDPVNQIDYQGLLTSGEVATLLFWSFAIEYLSSIAANFTQQQLTDYIDSHEQHASSPGAETGVALMTLVPTAAVALSGIGAELLHRRRTSRRDAVLGGIGGALVGVAAAFAYLFYGDLTVPQHAARDFLGNLGYAGVREITRFGLSRLLPTPVSEGSDVPNYATFSSALTYYSTQVGHSAWASSSSEAPAISHAVQAATEGVDGVVNSSVGMHWSTHNRVSDFGEGSPARANAISVAFRALFGTAISWVSRRVDSALEGSSNIANLTRNLMQIPGGFRGELESFALSGLEAMFSRTRALPAPTENSVEMTSLESGHSSRRSSTSDRMSGSSRTPRSPLPQTRRRFFP